MNHQHTGRKIKARLRGDEVVAIENFGADVTLFDPLQAPRFPLAYLLYTSVSSLVR